jgi:hypothetical protein
MLTWCGWKSCCAHGPFASQWCWGWRAEIALTTRSSSNFSGGESQTAGGRSIQRRGQFVIVTGPRLEQVRFNMTNEPSNPNVSTTESPLQRWIVASLVLAGAFVIFGFVAAWLGYQPPRHDKEYFLTDLGNYGSYLQGTVASLWALGAGFLVLAAFLGQKQQLALQREELEITRNQLAEQKQQSSEQNKSINRQDFESQFFHLLNFHHALVSGMKVGDDSGRNCLEKLYLVLRQRYSDQVEWHVNGGGTLSNEQDFRIVCKQSYDVLLRGYQSVLGHYFRNLYHLIKFVDGNQDMDYETKKHYTTLVRAQLSAHELTLLFYNCIHPVGEDFYLLVQDYSLLHNLNEELIFAPAHKALFEPKAYEGTKKSGGRTLPPAASSHPAICSTST